MSVDLKSRSSFARISVLLMDDCVMKIEHSYTKDRIRKAMYENIESVTISQSFAGLRIAIVVILLLLPGLLLIASGNTGAIVSGSILLALGILFLTIYLIYRKTNIRIIKGGKNFDITGLFRPKRVRRFRDTLILGIRRVQATSSAGASPAATVEQSAEPNTEKLA